MFAYFWQIIFLKKKLDLTMLYKKIGIKKPAYIHEL